ncbi:DUF378 domain-containing protein [Desulfocucumis palustris]|uniref:DUF378 domain-containing protein n=1 Tax=Desulfocucumis palustris TaxID=1898651 RepID=A0A2L2XAG7_9FIRM|nr:DUF378 domain-containing protein [Desulfocucumis palustris]GBF33052.1 DUF378 domain-containing protein [Desulfocucumis palustris]
MQWLNKTALVLVIIGAINWLLVGLFQWDLVTTLLGGDTVRNSSLLSRIIYTLVGISGLYLIPWLFRERLKVDQNQ